MAYIFSVQMISYHLSQFIVYITKLVTTDFIFLFLCHLFDIILVSIKNNANIYPGIGTSIKDTCIYAICLGSVYNSTTFAISFPLQLYSLGIIQKKSSNSDSGDSKPRAVPPHCTRKAGLESSDAIVGLHAQLIVYYMLSQ